MNGRPVVALAPAAAALTGLALTPTPITAAHQLASSLHATAGTDPLAPVTALAALLLWALAGWLLIVVALTTGGHLPGRAGRAAAACARRSAPAAVRRLVELALGLSVVVGGLGAVPAYAGQAVPGPVPIAATLDWPTPPPAPELAPLIAPTPTPALDWTAPTRLPARHEVVVHPGDSLWAIAADHLPAGASPAAVAQAWPAWWAANRDAVGADPDLIQPGQRLTPPA